MFAPDRMHTRSAGAIFQGFPVQYRSGTAAPFRRFGHHRGLDPRLALPMLLGTPMKPSLLMTLLVFGLAPLLHAGPQLAVEPRPGGVAFFLTETAGTTPWVLEHSRDGATWTPLAFFAQNGDGSTDPNLDLSRELLDDANAAGGLFRAVQLAEDDPFLRQFVTEQAKWRTSGATGYQYELAQSAGWTSWRGLISVTGGEVTSYRTFERFPPEFGDPQIPSVNELFARIADAIARDAFEIRVTWDRTLGYPVSGYIDLDDMIADEQSGWTVHSFTLVP